MEDMYMFPPHGERKKNNVFTAEISVFLRETNTSTIFTRTFYFFPFIFLSCIKKGQFVMKGFHYIDRKKKKHLTHFFLVRENKTTQRLEMNFKLWTATVE